MELVKYRVNNFRSVQGTDWIEINDWACFVGLNESGKTNLLLPLWKFNPANKETTIEALSDYPKSIYDDSSDEQENERFVDVLFKLNSHEVEYFQSLIIEENEKRTEALSAPPSDEASEDEEDSSYELLDIKFGNYFLVSRRYDGFFNVWVSNAKAEQLKTIPKLPEELWANIRESMPKFIYYSKYGELDSDIDLSRIIPNLEQIEQLSDKEQLKARTLKTLFSFLNLKAKVIYDLGQDAGDDAKNKKNKKRRKSMMDKASNTLTKKFNKWWKHGDYTFELVLDGNNFTIYVSDKMRPEKIELEYRSSGLKWALSFFLVFSVESKGKHENCVLLLDEPGLGLHPIAQADLVGLFKELSEENQLIYTTHLPFLIDSNNLDKTNVVYTKKGLTKISNDLRASGDSNKTIQPIFAAIGLTTAESLLIGCDVVLVEGESDYYYLSMIKNYLSPKKIKLKRDIIFIPAGGTKATKFIVPILFGSSEGKLPCILLDSDNAGKERKRALEKDYYRDSKKKILGIDDFIKKKGGEIEDIIPEEMIINAFNSYFDPEGKKNYQIPSDGTKPIITIIEEFAENSSDINLKQHNNWKVEISKIAKINFNGEVSPEWEAIWIKLFEEFQKKSET